MRAAHARRLGVAAAVAAQTLFAWLVLAGLDAPLLWHDEADTAMFGRRVLEYGFPKVHGPRNTVYGVQHPLALGVHAGTDAYRGSPWGQYYFAAPAVAWSDAATELGERTRRVRLPFALAGWLGVVLLGAAAAGLWPAAAGGRARFWLGFAACGWLSVSLQLHLREARYYPLAVLGLGAVAWIEARSLRHGRSAVRDLGLAALLVGVFNVFYPAFAALAIAAGVGFGARALASGGTLRARSRGFVRAIAPYAAAGLVVAPLALLYGLPAQGRAFLEAFAGPEHRYAARLLDGLSHLWRFEWLAPAALGAAGLAVVRRRAGEGAAAVGPALGACDGALLLAGVWLLVVARTPFFYERYLVALSPLLAAVCVLQAGCLVALWRSGPRRGVAAVGVVVALAGVGSALARAPELRGRWAELREPYRGPLDHAIPYLARRYPDAEGLVVATNYEGPSYMFYLGATATLGFYAPDPDRDLAIQPDVLIPRPWGVNLRALEALAARAPYTPHDLPVANLRANNVPSLSARNQARLVHRFESAAPGEGLPPLRIWEREPPPE